MSALEANSGASIVSLEHDPVRQKKPRKRRQKKPRKRAPSSNDIGAGASAMSIKRFCLRNDISEAMYYKLQANGLGQRTMALGARTLITIEAETDWRDERERNPVNVEAADVARRQRKP
jgi:hypothetical protein